jgi:hypothetical protein
MVDAEDDYDIKQDRLQISRNDKNIFRKLESSLLTAPNPEAGDTPSIQQINNSIRTDEKQPKRDRRFNRKTASVQSDSQQSKAYNAWIASNKNKLKAITVEDLKQLHTDLASIQEISSYQYVKNVNQTMFSEEMKVMFDAAIQQLPLRGVFNLSKISNYIYFTTFI